MLLFSVLVLLLLVNDVGDMLVLLCWCCCSVVLVHVGVRVLVLLFNRSCWCHVGVCVLVLLYDGVSVMLVLVCGVNAIISVCQLRRLTSHPKRKYTVNHLYQKHYNKLGSLLMLVCLFKHCLCSESEGYCSCPVWMYMCVFTLIYLLTQCNHKSEVRTNRFIAIWEPF